MADVFDSDNAAAHEAPGRAMRVARALSSKGGLDFAKPGKLVEVRFVKGQSLSLTASRLLALMILTAGGDAWRDITHKMRKSDIRRGHKGNERIVEMLEELHRTLFAEDDTSWRGKKATRRFALIQMSREETGSDEDDDVQTGWIEWEFTPDARRLIQESQSYAVLNRQAVLGFRSSYALRLYEMGALRLHRRQSAWRGDMAALRAALGIPPEVYKDFAQLRRKVLDVAKSEINQLAHYTVEWREVRKGRTVVEIEFQFQAKDAPAHIETLDEISRHSSGRPARREKKVELVEPLTPVQADKSVDIPSATVTQPDIRKGPAKPPALDADASAMFPTGSLRFATSNDFRAIALAHGGGWDVDLIASAYRETMNDRLQKLTGTKLRSSWRGFCESWLARRGRP